MMQMHQNLSIESDDFTDKKTLSKQFSVMSNTLSLQSTSSVLCRICYGTTRKEPLVKPCNCSGTMGFIHRSCLEKWLASSNSNQCEICSHKFAVIRTPKPFLEWILNPTTPTDYKNLMSDIICFLVLTPLACISAWLCVLGALKYNEWDSNWESVGLILLTCFLMLIYIVWFSVSIRYHIKIFREWQSSNHVVSLKLSDLDSNTNLEAHLLSSNNSSPVTRFQTNMQNCSPRVDISFAARHFSVNDQCDIAEAKNKDNTINDITKCNPNAISSPKENCSNDNEAYVADCVIELNKQ